ncbi:MAG TPA: hypothetical protein VF828_00470 [Patescibacteria group bacterium]
MNEAVGTASIIPPVDSIQLPDQRLSLLKQELTIAQRNQSVFHHRQQEHTTIVNFVKSRENITDNSGLINLMHEKPIRFFTDFQTADLKQMADRRQPQRQPTPEQRVFAARHEDIMAVAAASGLNVSFILKEISHSADAIDPSVNPVLDAILKTQQATGQPVSAEMVYANLHLPSPDQIVSAYSSEIQLIQKQEEIKQQKIAVRNSLFSRLPSGWGINLLDLSLMNNDQITAAQKMLDESTLTADMLRSSLASLKKHLEENSSHRV